MYEALAILFTGLKLYAICNGHPWSTSIIRPPTRETHAWITSPALETAPARRLPERRMQAFKPAIIKFPKRHRDALVPLMNWYRVTKRADWSSSAEVGSDFSHAYVVGRRTVFNIHGNGYMLIARVSYKTKRVFILHILTHVEYNKGLWKR
jgi:mRNA interferase HigB